MFDTHCHLNLDVFDGTIDYVVKSAKNAGVTRMLVPGVDIDSSKTALSLADKYPSIYAAVGIHPTVDLKEEALDKQLREIEKMADSSDSVVAIGEIGLDHYKYKSPSRIQKIFFQKQLELAAKIGKSVVIHNRHATEELIGILENSWSQALEDSVVFHCAEPNDKLLAFAKVNGVYLGIDGDITYNKDKQDFVKKVPLDLMVVETDSPFLTPLPMRDRGVEYNEPKYIPTIIKKVSSLLAVGEDKIKERTTKNALNLFGIV